MGIEKLGITFAEQCTKYAKTFGKSSILHTKPARNSSFEGLRNVPNIQADSLELSNITLDEIRRLREGEFYKAVTNPHWLPEMAIFKLPETELLNAMKNKDYKTILSGFSFELFHNNGAMSYLEQKGVLNIFRSDKNIANQISDEYLQFSKDFYKVFDDYLFPLSKNKKCRDIEQKLLSMGINVRLTEHADMAEDVYRACIKMKKAGIKEFPNYRIEARNTSPCGIGLGDKDIKQGYVILGGVKQKNNICVNDTVEGMVFHETAHCLNSHFLCSDSINCFAKEDKYFQSINDILKKYVSIYAASNPNEACSEIFCGLMSGKKYPKEVMDILEYYNGAKPNI